MKKIMLVFGFVALILLIFKKLNMPTTEPPNQPESIYEGEIRGMELLIEHYRKDVSIDAQIQGIRDRSTLMFSGFVGFLTFIYSQFKDVSVPRVFVITMFAIVGLFFWARIYLTKQDVQTGNFDSIRNSILDCQDTKGYNTKKWQVLDKIYSSYKAISDENALVIQRLHRLQDQLVYVLIVLALLTFGVMCYPSFVIQFPLKV